MLRMMLMYRVVTGLSLRATLLCVAFGAAVASPAFAQSKIASGDAFTVVKSDGTVWAWGENSDCLVYRNSCRTLT